ncbi:MAG: Stf0 family sulfotransferase [Myxococcota bacterium]
MLIDPRNGPDFDLPSSSSAPRSYVIAATPRTGSTLLCRGIWDTGLAGAPKEYFNPVQLRDWELRFGAPRSRLLQRALRGPGLALVGRRGWTPERLRAHWLRVRAHRSAASGWCGLKLHRHHRERLFGAEKLEDLLGEIRWIRITRRDRLAQAVSWSRALRTGRFASHQRGWLPPLYRRRHIEACLRALEEQEAAWDAELAGCEVLSLVYEDLVADWPQGLRAVLCWLSLPGADAVELPEPALPRQADARTARWIDRFEVERAQAKWQYRGRVRPAFAEEPGPGRESVWDYPRPPRIERDTRRVEVRVGEVVLADSVRALRVLETAGPPTFYLPAEDVRVDRLLRAAGRSECEWKGSADYWSLAAAAGTDGRVAWSYPVPRPGFEALAGHFAFYPGRMECRLGDERVRPQPGGFYGGWVTSEIAGPFKGEAGSEDW